MVISNQLKRKMLKMVSSFQSAMNVSQYKLRNLIIIDDCSDLDGSIQIDEKWKEFTIRIWAGNMSGEHQCLTTLMHELTHLFLYEMNEFCNFLSRVESSDTIKIEAMETYEKMTYRLTEIFNSIYIKQEKQ